MLIRLSRNAYLRQYGPYTYFFEHHTSQDKVFEDCEVFSRWISRVPIERSEILKRIWALYDAVEPSVIAADLDEFLDSLLEIGVLVSGDTPEELDAQDKVYFSYDVSDPKTTRDTRRISKNEQEQLTQNLLGPYFRDNPCLFDLQIDIIQACTERCVHCYIPEYTSLHLSFENICQVIDEFRKLGGIHISFSGGECMLHPDFDRILRYAFSTDLTVGILSNLTLCTDEKVQVLQDTHAVVQVSLYSMEPSIHDAITCLPGSHAKTKDAIERLHRANVPVGISCPTMKENFEGYTRVLEYAESLKMSAQTDFILMAKSEHDRSNLSHRLSAEQVKILLRDIVMNDLPIQREYFDPSHKPEIKSPEEQADEPLCGAGFDKLCLGADGNYYPCPGFYGFPVGNCFEQKLDEIWHQSAALKYLRGLRGRDIKECIHCKNRSYCSICLVRNYNETGDMLKISRHYCEVADLNRQVVEEMHHQLEEEIREK